MSPTFTSMIAFNAWMYNIFLIVAVITWWLTFKTESIWLKPLLVFGGFMSILFPSQSGVFFEAVRINEFWHSPILSVLFLASAIALGASGLLLARTVQGLSVTGVSNMNEENDAVHRLRVIAVLAILVYVVFEFAEFSLVFWSPGPHSPSVNFLLFGDYWSVFWIFHLLLGVLVPLAFFGASRRSLWVLAAILVGVGFGAARMCVLTPGQVSGQIAGLQQAFQDARLTYSYHPTSMEYLVGAFMLALGMAIFYVGMRLTQNLAARTEQKA